MAWTYSGDPAGSTSDAVRFLIGDTDTTNQLLLDAEITYLLAQWDNSPYVAAAHGCDSLAAKFAAKSDYSKSVGDLSLTTKYGEQSARYTALGASLLAQAASAAPPTPSIYIDADGYVGHQSKFSIDMDRNV